MNHMVIEYVCLLKATKSQPSEVCCYICWTISIQPVSEKLYLSMCAWWPGKIYSGENQSSW